MELALYSTRRRIHATVSSFSRSCNYFCTTKTILVRFHWIMLCIIILQYFVFYTFLAAMLMLTGTATYSREHERNRENSKWELPCPRFGTSKHEYSTIPIHLLVLDARTSFSGFLLSSTTPALSYCEVLISTFRNVTVFVRKLNHDSPAFMESSCLIVCTSVYTQCQYLGFASWNGTLSERAWSC